MGNLIDRQAAIDAIGSYILSFTAIDRNYYEGLRDAKKLLYSVQSVEPEIIRCKDCTHYNAGFECLIEGYGIERDEDWFCGDAERRTDG